MAVVIAPLSPMRQADRLVSPGFPTMATVLLTGAIGFVGQHLLRPR
jgi:hypothetical protein